MDANFEDDEDEQVDHYYILINSVYYLDIKKEIQDL